MMRLAGCLLAGLTLSAALGPAAEGAVTLLYHHVSEDSPPSTSVAPELFARHLTMIEKGGYTVWTLGRILNHLQSGARLPTKTVSISFDDAYVSVYQQAWPMLRERGWPFTVFINTDAVDAGYGATLSWQQLREMRRHGMELGNHSASHAHLVRRLPAESEQQWRERVRLDIERASLRLGQELDAAVTLFAYPYGEYDEALKQLVGALGLIGVGQQSGAIGAGFDALSVPRFPMAGLYAAPARFQATLDRRPLPVVSLAAGPLVQREGRTQNYMEFSLAQSDFLASAVACYASTGDSLPLVAPQQANGRYRVYLPPMAAGRNKVNCTAPHVSLPGVFYWHSRQWLVKRADGSWYEE